MLSTLNLRIHQLHTKITSWYASCMDRRCTDDKMAVYRWRNIDGARLFVVGWVYVAGIILRDRCIVSVHRYLGTVLRSLINNTGNEHTNKIQCTSLFHLHELCIFNDPNKKALKPSYRRTTNSKYERKIKQAMHE